MICKSCGHYNRCSSCDVCEKCGAILDRSEQNIKGKLINDELRKYCGFPNLYPEMDGEIEGS